MSRRRRQHQETAGRSFGGLGRWGIGGLGLIGIAGVLFLGAGLILAQSGVTLPWTGISGGGGESSSASFQLSDSLGQPVALSVPALSEPGSSGDYVLQDGLWPVVVNHAPRLDAPAVDASLVLTASGQNQSVTLSGIGPGGSYETDELQIVATTDRPDLLSLSTVYTSPEGRGLLAVQPGTLAGTGLVTVTVNDGRGYLASASRAFPFTVMGHYRMPVIYGTPLRGPDLVVESIQATAEGLSITIQNDGDTTTRNNFWIDLYVDPREAPTAVNQLWYFLGEAGATWGIADHMAPGDQITLTINDERFAGSAYSELPSSLSPGTPLYVQVDVWNSETNYGTVWESHERNGEPTNNIVSFITEETVPLPEITSRQNGTEGLPSRSVDEQPPDDQIWLPVVGGR